MEKSSPGRIIVRHFSSADIPTAPLFSLAEATFRAAMATNQQSTATSLVRNHRTHTMRCKLVTKLVETKLNTSTSDADVANLLDMYVYLATNQYPWLLYFQWNKKNVKKRMRLAWVCNRKKCASCLGKHCDITARSHSSSGLEL